MRPPLTCFLAILLAGPVVYRPCFAQEYQKPNPLARVTSSTPQVTLPAGIQLRVRINQSISTRRNRSGEHFEGELESPLAVSGIPVIPKGTLVRGVVREAEPSGRLKGRAVLVLALDSVEVHGHELRIETDPVTRTSGKHRGRALWIGGGAGSGALIGGLAAGPVGLAIGAGAGATAGLVSSAATGRKQINIPPESIVTFRLRKSTLIRG
jgi:hypothetical protein